MRVYITDTNQYDNLSYIIRCQNETAALLERWGADTHFEYDSELDAYKCTKEYFDFFSNFMKTQEILDARIGALAEKYGDAVYDAINEAHIDSSDAEQHHLDLIACLDTFEASHA